MMAALKLRRKFIGIEIDSRNFEVASAKIDLESKKLSYGLPIVLLRAGA